MPSEIDSTPVSFANASGLTLAGTLSQPAGREPTTWAIIVHCFTCHRNYKGIYNIAKALNVAGYGVLRFDFSGLGDSQGRFEKTTFSDNLSDVLAAAQFLTDQGKPPHLLIGHSLGGSAMLMAARKIAAARCVATVSTSSSPALLRRLFAGVEEAMAAAPDQVFPVSVSGRDMPFTYPFLADLPRHNLEAAQQEMTLPHLVLHSPDDATTPFSEGEKLYANARQPKSFVSIPGADHLLSKREDAEYAGRVIAAWASRYV